MNAPEPPDTGWADRPENQRRIRIALYAVCAVLVIAEFLIHRHAYNAVEAVPVFYAAWGFASLLLAVAVAKGLRRLIRRDEDYYDDA